MTAQNLGRLERVELCDIWKREDTDFTPWLAQERNLQFLGDAIGLELELEATEENVGPFRADMLCKNVDDGCFVLIENQIKPTDHKHLGQLFTYAAGLKAVTIVWVASKFQKEHRAALDWLNTITDETVHFFGLEVELWRIGDSLAAPKFNSVAKPNDWSKSTTQASRRIIEEGVSEVKQLQHQYWLTLSEYLKTSNSLLRPHKPSPQHWQNFSAGRSGFTFAVTVNTQTNRIGVELYMSDGWLPFSVLHEQKKDIELKIGCPLEWRNLPEKKASRIIVYRDESSIKDKGAWNEQYAWFQDKLEAFERVFRPRIKIMNLEGADLI